jgi:hypothetical protein
LFVPLQTLQYFPCLGLIVTEQFFPLQGGWALAEDDDDADAPLTCPLPVLLDARWVLLRSVSTNCCVSRIRFGRAMRAKNAWQYSGDNEATRDGSDGRCVDDTDDDDLDEDDKDEDEDENED